MRQSDSDDDPFGWNPWWGLDGDVDCHDEFNPTPNQISVAVPQQLHPPLIPIVTDSGKHQLKTSQQTGKRGTRREAAKTAMFRMHNVDSSKVVSEWKKQREGTTITKPLLMTLIKSILEFCPPYQRPSLPTRSMKRTKHGLVFWLDTNQTIAFHYFNGVRWNT
jgi:hypothetical protein